MTADRVVRVLDVLRERVGRLLLDQRRAALVQLLDVLPDRLGAILVVEEIEVVAPMAEIGAYYEDRFGVGEEWR